MFEEKFNFLNVSFEREFKLLNVSLKGEFKLLHVSFERKFKLLNVSLEGEFKLLNVSFEGEFNFLNVSFKGEELACKLQLSEARVQVSPQSQTQHLYFHPTILQHLFYSQKEKIMCLSGLVPEPASQVAEEGAPEEDRRPLLWHLMSVFRLQISFWVGYDQISLWVGYEQICFCVGFEQISLWV